MKFDFFCEPSIIPNQALQKRSLHHSWPVPLNTQFKKLHHTNIRRDESAYICAADSILVSVLKSNEPQHSCEKWEKTTAFGFVSPSIKPHIMMTDLRHLAVQVLSTSKFEDLTPLSTHCFSLQATINIGTIGDVAHNKSTVVKATCKRIDGLI